MAFVTKSIGDFNYQVSVAPQYNGADNESAYVSINSSGAMVGRYPEIVGEDVFIRGLYYDGTTLSTIPAPADELHVLCISINDSGRIFFAATDTDYDETTFTYYIKDGETVQSFILPSDISEGGFTSYNAIGMTSDGYVVFKCLDVDDYHYFVFDPLDYEYGYFDHIPSIGLPTALSLTITAVQDILYGTIDSGTSAGFIFSISGSNLDFLGSREELIVPVTSIESCNRDQFAFATVEDSLHFRRVNLEETLAIGLTDATGTVAETSTGLSELGEGDIFYAILYCGGTYNVAKLPQVLNWDFGGEEEEVTSSKSVSLGCSLSL